MIDVEANKKEFLDIVANCIHRDGIDKLVAWLNASDFFTAPASHCYHGAEPGGLCAHSLAVYKRLKAKQEDEDDETIAIAALFHDLCKVNFYKPGFRNVKNPDTGKWESVPSYSIDDQWPAGHGEKSVFILMALMSLSDDEIMAIRWHMGFSVADPQFEKPALSKALGMYKLVLKLSESDMEASFWDGK